MLAFQPALLYSQFKNRDLQGMVDTERAFIQMAKEQTTRDAFLYYLSDDAITSGANGPVKGKEGIRKQPANAGWLCWEVAYCDIASSGDFGYNTGPWEYRASKTDEKAVAFGEFHSVWKKQTDGSWKNILDIGIRHAAPTEKLPLATTSKPLPRSSKKPLSLSSLITQEKEFLIAFGERGLAAYPDFASAEIRFSREGHLPFVSDESKKEFLKNNNPFSNLQLLDGGIASSGDLGVVYGTADVSITNDGKLEKKEATYLRIWKREGRKDWKIVLDVMTYQ